VFTLRGLACKWKKPNGYNFVTSCTPSPRLVKHLLKCINIATEYCLIVKAMICDQGSNNQAMVTKQLRASVSKSYFMHNNNRVISKLGRTMRCHNILFHFTVAIRCFLSEWLTS